MAVLRKSTSRYQLILPNEYFLWEAKRAWYRIYKEIVETPIPPNFLKLFNSSSKTEQERLMNGASLTPYQLCNLWFAASIKFSCSYSNYTSVKLPNGIQENDLPKFAHIAGEKIAKIGNTVLSEGQLKNLINHRKVIIARFLDNKDSWHCFYQTIKGVAGEEKGATGRPHLHYISDKWGYSRADVVKLIKSGSCPCTKIHIDLIE